MTSCQMNFMLLD